MTRVRHRFTIATLNQEIVWQINRSIRTARFFEITSKRRKGFPSETRVQRGLRVVHGDKELHEKLGRNDPCPCGSGRSFQELLPALRSLRRPPPQPLLPRMTWSAGLRPGTAQLADGSTTPGGKQRGRRRMSPPAPVAQVGNLLYHRLGVGKPSLHWCLRIGNPRYSRLPVCAT